jgi:hypothetical protein
VTGLIAEFAIGSICFAASTVVSIRLRDDLAVTAAVAIAPAVAVSGAVAVDSGLSHWVLVVPSLMAALAMILAKRTIYEVIGHSVLYGACALALSHLVSGSNRSTVPVLVASAFGGLCYLFADGLRQRRVSKLWEPVNDLMSMWILLQIVVLSASGLTVMVLDQLSWGAFVAMAAVLAITKKEFESFALSRRAFRQTTLALARLTSPPR